MIWVALSAKSALNHGLGLNTLWSSIVLLANKKKNQNGKCSLNLLIYWEIWPSDLSGSLCLEDPSLPSAARWMLFHAQPFADFSGLLLIDAHMMLEPHLTWKQGWSKFSGIHLLHQFTVRSLVRRFSCGIHKLEPADLRVIEMSDL